ncbi:MAG TPA: hypothetical protein VGC66_21960 [Pyrinomonadaceae bacterium]|jgi:hypothetical protein
MNSILTSLLVACTILAGFTPFPSIAHAQKPINQRNGFDSQRELSEREVTSRQGALRETTTTLVVRAGQITKTQIESPGSNDEVNVINRTNSTGDVDFVATDKEGNEVARETVVVDPKHTANFNLQNLFPQLALSELSTVHMQASARPTVSPATPVKGQGGDTTQYAKQLAVAFFSQRDPAWSSNQLGTCSGTTIGSAGCAISTIAMAGARSVSNFNPASLNTYLTNNSGYASGCLVIWSAAANIDGAGGFTYIGTGTVSSAANLKSIIDSNRFPIAKSARFSSHFGIIIGYDNQGTALSDFYYLDPWDTSAVFRRVNDGWVTASSATRIYQ